MDIEELKRLYAPTIIPDENRRMARATFEEYMHDAWPHILAKLEAAQTEREQLNEQLRKMGADWLATAINGMAESLPAARIRSLVEQHGSYRKVGELLGVDHAYLHRIASGEKDNMSDELLRKIGLRRGTFYTSFDKEQQ